MFLMDRFFNGAFLTFGLEVKHYQPTNRPDNYEFPIR